MLVKVTTDEGISGVGEAAIAWTDTDNESYVTSFQSGSRSGSVSGSFCS